MKYSIAKIELSPRLLARLAAHGITKGPSLDALAAKLLRKELRKAV